MVQEIPVVIQTRRMSRSSEIKANVLHVRRSLGAFLKDPATRVRSHVWLWFPVMTLLGVSREYVSVLEVNGDHRMNCS